MMNSMPGHCGLRDLIRLTALRIVPPLSSCDVLGCSLLLRSIRISNGKAFFSSRPSRVLYFHWPNVRAEARATRYSPPPATQSPLWLVASSTGSGLAAGRDRHYLHKPSCASRLLLQLDVLPGKGKARRDGGEDILPLLCRNSGANGIDEGVPEE